MSEFDAGLTAPDPAARAAAIARVRFKDLREPEILRAVLRLCRDPALVPGREGKAEDPFAAFFSGTATASATVAEVASERLQRTGVPAEPAAAEVIAEVLREDGPPGRLPRTVAKALGETRFTDLPAALAAIVPALDRYDEPLFEAIARLPEEGWAVLARLATAPLRPRLVQELLNHAPAHDLVVVAAEEAVLEGRLAPDASVAAALLSILASWSEPAVARIAQHLEPALPWTVAWRAIDDPSARPALAAWLEAGAPGAPDGLLPRLVEVLRQRERLEGFPAAELLRAVGEDRGLATSWGLEDPALVELLCEWARDLPDPRGWSAASLLVRAGAHAPVLAELERGLAERDPERAVPWEPDLLEAFARAAPPVPGLEGALLFGLRFDPSAAAVAVPALLALGPQAGRVAAEQVLAAAEAASAVVERAGKGTVREHRAGVDVEALAPVIEAVGDPALRARFEAVLPIVRAG